MGAPSNLGFSMCAEASTTRYVQAADAGSVVDSQTTAGLRNQLNGMVGLGGGNNKGNGGEGRFRRVRGSRGVRVCCARVQDRSERVVVEEYRLIGSRSKKGRGGQRRGMAVAAGSNGCWRLLEEKAVVNRRYSRCAWWSRSMAG